MWTPQKNLVSLDNGFKPITGPTVTKKISIMKVTSALCQTGWYHSTINEIEKCVFLILLKQSLVVAKNSPSKTKFKNFACSVILPGWAFLRRLIDLTVGVRMPNHYIRLNREGKEDLNLWLSFFSNFNGKFFFLTWRYMAEFIQVKYIHWCFRYLRFWSYIWVSLVLWEMAF